MDYLVRVRHYSKHEAMPHYFGKGGQSSFPSKRPRYASKSASQQVHKPASKHGAESKWPDSVEDPKAWQDAASELLAWAIRGIELPEARSFWEGRRFLTAETVRELRLGWVTQDKRPPRHIFGLKPVDGYDYLIIPKGLLMPIFESSELVGLEVRTLAPLKSGGHHKVITGSRGASVIFGELGQSVVLLESILDAALLWQESRHAVACIASAGAGKSLSQRAMAMLEAAPKVFACPDCDTGGRAAVKKWEEASSRLQVVFPYLPAALGFAGNASADELSAKDLCDMQALALRSGNAPTVKVWYERFIKPLVGNDANREQGQNFSPSKCLHEPASEDSQQEVDLEAQEQALAELDALRAEYEAQGQQDGCTYSVGGTLPCMHCQRFQGPRFFCELGGKDVWSFSEACSSFAIEDGKAWQDVRTGLWIVQKSGAG